MIVVDAEDTDKIRLILNGVKITNKTSAAVYVVEADKVFITTASGTENTFENTGEYIAIDENNIDAVIFSKSDLTLNGSGTLSITAQAGHGIVSKDDLVITGGTYDITSASHGLSGKDSIRISNGDFTITSNKDGLHAENNDDPEKGFIYIAGGDFTIKSNGDSISAAAYLQIENGNFTITTGEGSAGAAMVSDNMGFGARDNLQTTASTETVDSESIKGIKSDGTLTITDGSFVMDTQDDSFHACNDITVSGGTFDIKSGDDAIHSDTNVNIQNGDFTISYCYEGIEGNSITIDNGSFNITAVDDGINAAGDDKSDIFITINGGTFVIVSSGDCIDSNNSLTLNGGSLNLTCNGNGNTALDCDGSYSNNGADVTTNDGSENNPGQMGGQGGFGGKGGMGFRGMN